MRTTFPSASSAVAAGGKQAEPPSSSSALSVELLVVDTSARVDVDGTIVPPLDAVAPDGAWVVASDADGGEVAGDSTTVAANGG